jgi:hypothetical protein
MLVIKFGKSITYPESILTTDSKLRSTNSVRNPYLRLVDVRSILMFYRSLMVGGFDRDDERSGFGLSINDDDFMVVLSIAGGDFMVVLSIVGGGGFDRCDVRSGFGVSIDPCCLNVGMVKLNHIQSAPSHHEYDRIDSPGTRENPRTNATEPFRLYPFPW